MKGHTLREPQVKLCLNLHSPECCTADEAVKGNTRDAQGRPGTQDGPAQQEETASLQGSVEGSAFGSSFQGQPSQHEADGDSVTSHLGPALGLHPLIWQYT